MSGSSDVSFDLTVAQLTEPKEGSTHEVNISSIQLGSLCIRDINGLEGKYNQTVNWFIFSDKSQNDLIDCLMVIFPSVVVTEIFEIIQSLVLLNIKHKRALR